MSDFFEIPSCAHRTLTLSLSRKAGEDIEKTNQSPRPFRWERAKVRAISYSAGERKIMNRFVVVVFENETTAFETRAAVTKVRNFRRV
jgi:hypothetical protein